MKLKVGDKVKVIAALHKQACNVGGIVTIKKADVWDSCYLCDVDNVYDAWFYENELGAIENSKNNSFTISDLKDGDKCTLKNGQVIFFNKDSSRQRTLYAFDNLDKNFKYTINDDVSIVKVERPLKYETVFERKKEILDEEEKKYLADVIGPFRQHIMFISKTGFDGEEFLKIDFKRPVNSFSLPFFEKNSMYKGMKVDQKYTLEELGL